MKALKIILGILAALATILLFCLIFTVPFTWEGLWYHQTFDLAWRILAIVISVPGFVLSLGFVGGVIDNEL